MPWWWGWGVLALALGNRWLSRSFFFRAGGISTEDPADFFVGEGSGVRPGVVRAWLQRAEGPAERRSLEGRVSPFALFSASPHPEGPGIPPISGEGPPVICQGTHQHSPGLTQFSSFSPSVVSDSLRPHGPQHARPPCPSPTPKGYSDSCPSSR